MQITALRTAAVTRRYDGQARNTRHAWNAKNYVLVELLTAEGVSGLGEMYCDGGGTPEVARVMLEREVAPHVVGRDARLPGAIIQDLRSRVALSARGTAASAALSAVDIALWDLLGRVCGQPLHRLLGGCSNKAPVYASGGMYGPAITPERLATEMAAAQRAGLRGAKIKVGGTDLEEDAARIAAVRAAIGDAPLMADAMFAPDVTGAIRLGRRLAGFDLHFLEAPTAPQDVEGWREVAVATGVALAGPELSDDVGLMRRMLQAGAVRYLQFDVAIAGGLSGGRALAALAESFHRKVSLHCAASAVAMAAGAQLAAAVPNCDGLEFHLMHDGLRERLWASGWRLEDGALVIPDRPGLGIELDEEERAMLAAA
jgi:D-galactarolactone cycloisomerase